MVTRFLKVLLFVMGLIAVQVSAQTIETLMSNGVALLERGSYSQAVTAFRQVVAREPDHFEGQFNLAFAYLQWGRNSNAVEEFKKALAYQPKNSQIWSNMAIAYSNLGKNEEALYALTQAVTYDPENIPARINLASMYANANRPKQAKEQYEKVLAIDPSHEEALVNLSKCYIAEKQFDEAIKYLNKIVEAYPNNGEVHFELGNIYWKRQNNIDKALSEYKLAVTLKPENMGFYDNYEKALLEKGEKVDAIELLKSALLKTDDPLRKDKIQTEINRLETGSTTGQTAIASEKLESKENISDLKSELRKGGANEGKRIDAKPVNVLGDLESLGADTTPKLDLRSEAKRKAAEK
jgi:tetratricopeptide (TPR) repeat protein